MINPTKITLIVVVLLLLVSNVASGSCDVNGCN